MLNVSSARVVAARKLTERAGRRAAGLFLVEGPNAVREALAAGAVRELFCTPAQAYEGVSYAGPIHLVDDRAAAALSETVHPQGVVAVCALADVPPEVALARRPQLAVLLAEVSDPGNAGTVLRTADAAGAGLVAFGGGSVDPYNGKVVRSAAGSHFHVDLVCDVPADQVIHAARAAGLRVLAATGDGSAGLDDEDAAGRLAAPTLWVLGNEARGLPPELASRCDDRVRIPIHGRAESLNLAAAAAVVLYTSARAQRR